MTRSEMEKMIGHKRHKYSAVRVTCRLGHRHPSKAEAMHCWDLQAQIKQGVIRDLEYERPFDLKVNGELVCRHYPDFTFKRPKFKYTPTGPLGNGTVAETDWDNASLCVDEVKGFKTADWVLKSKLFQVLYPDIEYRVLE